MEDKRIEMVEVTEDINEEYDYEEPVEGGRSFKGAIIAGGTLLVGGATALAVKKRDKIADMITERKIKKLEAKGYVIERPEISEEVDNESKSDNKESE